MRTQHLLDRGLLATPVLALALLGCDGATGSVSGGQALVAEPEGGGPPTWTALYADLFGPSGTASCSALASCHGAASDLGAQTSGFVCGASKDECWSGLTQGIPADAGGIFPPILNLDAGLALTSQQFYLGLHQPSSSTDNTNCSNAKQAFACNMPCGDPPSCQSGSASYTFTADDLARISTWIQQGAQDN